MLKKLRALMDACRENKLLVIQVLIDIADGKQPRYSSGAFSRMTSGVSTDVVVASTAWDASDLILAEDCCVCATKEDHDSTVKQRSLRCEQFRGADKSNFRAISPMRAIEQPFEIG